MAVKNGTESDQWIRKFEGLSSKEKKRHLVSGEVVAEVTEAQTLEIKADLCKPHPRRPQNNPSSEIAN